MMTPKQLRVEIDARLDGPHADEHTAAAADLAAEAVRYLNYATGSHAPEGLSWPSTVYQIAGNLSQAASRMPQLLDQLAAWLRAQEAAGLLGTDDGTPAADVVSAADVRSAMAAMLAHSLAAELDALQNTISGLNGSGPNRPGGAL